MVNPKVYWQIQMTKKFDLFKSLITLLFIVCFLTKTPMRAQYFKNEGFGLKLSIIQSFGTHTQSTGFQISAHFKTAYFQFNTSNQLSLSTYNLGKRKLLIQNKFSSGIVLYDKNLTSDFIHTEWNDVRQQSGAKYALGYAYIWYKDNRQTSQRSGVWGVQLDHWFLLFENDLFAGQGRDRFRTGILQVDYFHRQNYYLLGIQLWTGETRGAAWKTDAPTLHPYGYRDLSNRPYGKTSHGLFYIGFKQSLAYDNQAVYKLGVDDEWVRQILQNKLSHDLPFFPKKWKRNTPHYPMLKQNGEPIIFGGKRRKLLPFTEVGINSPQTY